MAGPLKKELFLRLSLFNHDFCPLTLSQIDIHPKSFNIILLSLFPSYVLPHSHNISFPSSQLESKEPDQMILVEFWMNVCIVNASRLSRNLKFVEKLICLLLQLCSTVLSFISFRLFTHQATAF